MRDDFSSRRALCCLLVATGVYSLNRPASAQVFSPTPALSGQEMAAEEVVDENGRVAYNKRVALVGTLPVPDAVSKIVMDLQKVLDRESLRQDHGGGHRAAPATIAVLNDQSVNAGGYPAGELFISKGLLDALDNNTDAVAWVLAHELTHVERKHSLIHFKLSVKTDPRLQNLIDNTTVDDATQKLLFDEPGGVRSSGSPDSAVELLKFTPDDEFEADRHGFVLAVKAGYKPDGAVTALKALAKITSDNPGQTAQMLYDHPAGRDRLKKLQSYVYALAHDHVDIDWIDTGYLEPGDRGLPPTLLAADGDFMVIRMDYPAAKFPYKRPARFEVDIKHEGFLTLVARAPSGKISLLFPNDYVGAATKLPGDVTVAIPGSEWRINDHPIKLKWTEKGAYQFVFLLTDVPLNVEPVINSGVGTNAGDTALKDAIVNLAAHSNNTVTISQATSLNIQVRDE